MPLTSPPHTTTPIVCTMYWWRWRKRQDRPRVNVWERISRERWRESKSVEERREWRIDEEGWWRATGKWWVAGDKTKKKWMSIQTADKKWISQLQLPGPKFASDVDNRWMASERQIIISQFEWNVCYLSACLFYLYFALFLSQHC